nr:synaptic vesicle glycoprotein 2A isoform X3 [Drosophila bipectinata]
MGDRGKIEEAVDFETAIAECGFGLFNVFILFSAAPCLAAMVFSASALSYVMPSAECDLNLTLVQKGMLNAATYGGMILSAVPWGFMADTFGRRPVLISGGWLDGIFILCAALSQSTLHLMIFKFLDGLIICGPFAVVVSYLAEFHGKKHRPYIMLFVGLAVSMGSMLLPFLAYILMPVSIYFKVGSLDSNLARVSCHFGGAQSTEWISTYVPAGEPQVPDGPGKLQQGPEVPAANLSHQQTQEQRQLSGETSNRCRAGSI